jgi:flavin reductase (DIM6/NTAB) family NADH-FMN oxidoreductase RutF
MTALNTDGVLLPHALRTTMRQHAAGVAVITTRDAQGQPSGFCATSLASLSLRPPTVSFAVAMASASGRAWRGAVHGIVHLLGSHQEEVASAFAASGPAKFVDRAGWSWGPGGQPLLDDVLAWMLVRARTRLMVGDHLLVVCDVREAAVREAAVDPGPGPLIRHDGGFRSLPDPAPSLPLR